MLHLNLDANIDLLADDDWKDSEEWLENQIARKLEVALLGMFNYPISADVTLENFSVVPGDNERPE